MTDQIKIVDNFKLGSIWASWILASLASFWPVPCNFDVEDIIENTKITPVAGGDLAAFVGLFRFLESEDFIRIKSITLSGTALGCSLTEKSMNRLNQVPEGLNGSSLKDNLIETAKDVAVEGAKGKMAELFGQVVGGFAKSISS